MYSLPIRRTTVTVLHNVSGYFAFVPKLSNLLCTLGMVLLLMSQGSTYKSKFPSSTSFYNSYNIFRYVLENRAQ
jgi:hypothetical protein